MSLPLPVTSKLARRTHCCEPHELVRWTSFRWTGRHRKPAHPRYRPSADPRKRGHQIDTKDTSYRLLQTDYLERAPNRIGDLPVRAVDEPG